MPDSKKEFQRRRIIFYHFLKFFIPIFTLFLSFTFGVSYIHKKQEIGEFHSSTQELMEVQRDFLQQTIQGLTADLLFISQYHILQEILESKGGPNLKALQEEFLDFAKEKPIFSQIRVLDAKGQEFFRIDQKKNKAHIAPQDQLQNKSKRYYFTKTISLSPSQFYISELDLNMEQGKVETPLNPVIRFATPIYSKTKKLIGILVLNASGRKILADIKKRVVGVHGHAMFLDQYGNYLIGMAPEREWGNSIAEREKFKLINYDKKSWEDIIKSDSGDTESENGIFHFSKIDLNELFNVSPTVIKYPHWYLVHHAAESDIIPEYEELNTFLKSAFLIITVLLVIGSLIHGRERAYRLFAEKNLQKYQEDLKDTIAKKTEELTSTQGLYKAVVETTANGIVITTGGKITFANSAFIAFTELEESKILGQEISDFFVDQQTIDSNDKNGHQTFHSSIFTPDGVEAPVECYSKHFSYSNQESTLFVIQDISERKKSEETIRTLSRAVEQSPVSIILTDPEGNIVYANPKFLEVTGFSDLEAYGNTPRLIKSGHHDPEFYKELWDTVVAGKDWHGEMLNRKKSGDYYWESVAISPIKDESGKVTHFLGIKEDITLKKNQENELEKAKEAAIASAKAKSEFLATMSHEIRTPMNGLIGMSGLLEETDLTPEQSQYVDTLQVSGKNLLRIINDILDFSKIEAGKLELEEETFVLHKVIEQSIETFALPLAHNEVEFRYVISPNVPKVVTGDPTRVNQILVNLIGNACKFTNSGEIVLSVDMGPPSSTSIELRFSVKDTGIGISKEQQERLFKAFTQADSSTTRKYGGTGLGLTISKRLCEIMNGNMWVESNLGEGSCFNFTLQLKKPRETQLSPQEPKELSAKVLVYQNDPAQATFIKDLSHEFKVEFTTASTFLETKNLLLNGVGFDFLIMDGISAKNSDAKLKTASTQLIKEATKQELPVIYSQFINENQKSKDLNYIPLYKPYKKTSLFNAMAKAIGAKKLVVKQKETGVNKSLGLEVPLSILLVEDNNINQLLAIKILQKLNFEPVLAENGVEAVEACQSEDFDIIFMDIQMPLMDGIEATKKIKEFYSEDKQPVIIAMTANTMPGDKQNYLRAGMDDYIPKPISPTVIQNTLIKWKDKDASKDQEVQKQTEEQPMLDLQLLDSNSGLGADFMAKFTESFCQHAEQVLKKAHQSTVEKDFGAIAEQGKLLHGIALNLGGLELALFGKKIQFKGEDENIRGLKDVLDQADQCFLNTKEELNKYLLNLSEKEKGNG